MRVSLTTLLGALAIASSAAAAPASLEARQSSLDNTRFNAMLRNIAGASSATLVPGAASGSVIASPSTDAPNYYYSWVRDSAMTFKVIIDAYIKGQHGVTRALIERWIQSEMVNAANARSSSSSLGEPKFNPDGSLFTGPWGRPQNDGPALRATAVMRYARAIGLSDSYTATLYKSDLSANSIIKSDLEYVAHHWQDSR
jgi:glucoamylase